MRKMSQARLRESASRENKNGYFERNHLESIRCIRTVPVEQQSISRDHSMAVNLRDLLEELAGTSKLLEAEWRT